MLIYIYICTEYSIVTIYHLNDIGVILGTQCYIHNLEGNRLAIIFQIHSLKVLEIIFLVCYVTDVTAGFNLLRVSKSRQRDEHHPEDGSAKFGIVIWMSLLQKETVSEACDGQENGNTSKMDFSN